MAQRILLTGHRGYLGSVMADSLVEAGHEVRGLDAGYFEDCTLLADRRRIEGRRVDLREPGPKMLEGFDAVVHLAALSNDPIGNLHPRWTEEINTHAAVELARLAARAGVRRFLFSSSCIMYGAARGGSARLAAEASPLDPRTAYARSKVEAEAGIARLASSTFSPVYLRNGTIYGLSPRMRFDTVGNSLAGSAVAAGVVRVLSDGKPWRPVVHIEDVCAAFRAALEAPREAIHNEAFNVGAEFVNIQIGELGRAVAGQCGARLELVSQPDADQRTYRTSFEKIRRHLPAFQPRWGPAEGARRLVEELRILGLTQAQFEDPRFTRLRWLQHLTKSGRLGGDLRWAGRLVEAGRD